jgi:lysophospholipase L1-like esterase
MIGIVQDISTDGECTPCFRVFTWDGFGTDERSPACAHFFHPVPVRAGVSIMEILMKRSSSMRLSYKCIDARYLVACLLIIVSGVAMIGFTVHPQKAQAASSPVKIMPLGDSITGSPGCWRALLWNNLQNTGYTNIHFVGTQPPQGCGIPYDGNNEGHGGALATNIVSLNELPGWLSATNPDIVLMHLGTNDVWSNIATSTILAAYSTLVDQMRANNPNMKILVAQIIPMNPSGCSYCAQGVITLDAAIPAWASSKSTAQSPVIAVDQWTGFNDSTDTVDGVHPNDAGNQKIASKWYPPLTAQLNTLMTPGPSTPTPARTTPTPGTTPTPSPTPRTTPTPSSTSTPGTGSACKVSYVVQNQWPGGFTTSVTITNTGSTTLNGWMLAFIFPDASQQVTQGWNATWSQSGQQVTAANPVWSTSLAAGASAGIGFNGVFGSSNPVPASFTLSGVTCAKG